MLGKDYGKLKNVLYAAILGYINDLFERIQYIYAMTGTRLHIFDITFYSSKAIWNEMELINAGYMTSMNEYHNMPAAGLIDKCSEDHFNYVPTIALRILFYLVHDHRAVTQPEIFKDIFVLVDNSRVNKNLCVKVQNFIKRYINYKEIVGETIKNIWSGKNINIDDFRFHLLQCWMHLLIRARNGGLFKNKKHPGVRMARSDLVHIYQRVNKYHVKENEIFKNLPTTLAEKFPKLKGKQTNPLDLYSKYPWLFKKKRFNSQMREFIALIYEIAGTKSLSKLRDLNIKRKLYESNLYKKHVITILSLIPKELWDCTLSLWIFDINHEEWSRKDLNKISNYSIPSYIAPASAIYFLLENLNTYQCGIFFEQCGYLNMKHLGDTIRSCYEWRIQKQRFGHSKKTQPLWDPSDKSVQDTFKNAQHIDTLYCLFLNGKIGNGEKFAGGGMQIENYHKTCNGRRVRYECLLTWKIHDILNKMMYNESHFYQNIIPKKVFSRKYLNIIEEIFRDFKNLTGILNKIMENKGWYTLQAHSIVKTMEEKLRKQCKFHTLPGYSQQFSDYQMTNLIRKYVKSENFSGIFKLKDINYIGNVMGFKDEKKLISIVIRICQMNYLIHYPLLRKYIDQQQYVDKYKENHIYNWQLTNLTIGLPAEDLDCIYFTRTVNEKQEIFKKFRRLVQNNCIYYQNDYEQYQSIKTSSIRINNEDYEECVHRKESSNKRFMKFNANNNTNTFPIDFNVYF